MVALVKSEANETIHEEGKSKKLKYHYQVNTNIIIGKLKESMILVLLEEKADIRQEMYRRIMKEIIKNKTPIRP
jgi:predicted transcriptional regulator